MTTSGVVSRLFVLSAIFALCGCAIDQAKSERKLVCSGQVLSEETGLPVKHRSIALYEIPRSSFPPQFMEKLTPRLIAVTTTDMNGLFEFSFKPMSGKPTLLVWMKSSQADWKSLDSSLIAPGEPFSSEYFDRVLIGKKNVLKIPKEPRINASQATR